MRARPVVKRIVAVCGLDVEQPAAIYTGRGIQLQMMSQ